MSQALGIAALIARSDLDAKRAITVTRNGINATNPLADRRNSGATGKFAPSPRIIAKASHDARKAAIINGMVDLVRADSEARGAAIAAMTVCAATMKMATAKMTNAVPRLRQSGREERSAWIIVVYTTMVLGNLQGLSSAMVFAGVVLCPGPVRRRFEKASYTRERNPTADCADCAD